MECGPTAHMVTPGAAACSAPVPEKASANFIKRVVAGPGDEIYVKEGHVFRKAAGTSRFVAEKDSYIKACGSSPECNFPKPITIPPGHWFMMGDNRGDSDDSRYWGPVPTGWIIGQAVATYCPPTASGSSEQSEAHDTARSALIGPEMRSPISAPTEKNRH
jgi:signal peptidase I